MTILDAIATPSWWSGPASITGRHHPPGQTNLSHALGTFRAARWAWRRVPWVQIRLDPCKRRAFLLAALCHDAGKQHDREHHEIAGADLALRLWPDVPLIAYLVLHHSGRWGPSYCDRARWMVRAQVGETARVIDYDCQRWQWLADLLAECDYMDAHAHVVR